LPSFRTSAVDITVAIGKNVIIRTGDNTSPLNVPALI
jgi:hypothetical protein